MLFGLHIKLRFEKASKRWHQVFVRFTSDDRCNV